MTADLRCEAKKHGIIIDDNIVEIKCDSRFCGAGPGRVVLHRFNSHTGELVETQRFKTPGRSKRDAASPAAVRSA